MSKKRERTSPRRWFECTLARSQYKVWTEGIFKCNVYLVRSSPLSSVSSIRKQRDREEFLLTLAKARVPHFIFLCYVDPVSKNPRNVRERHVFSLDERSYPTSSFEIGPKESRIDATGRNSLSPSSFFLFFDLSSFYPSIFLPPPFFNLSFSLSIYLSIYPIVYLPLVYSPCILVPPSFHIASFTHNFAFLLSLLSPSILCPVFIEEITCLNCICI